MAGRSDSRSAVLLDLDETMLQSDRGFHRAARDTAQALCRDSPAVDAEVLRDTLIAAIDRVWQAKTIDQKWYGTNESEWVLIWEETLTAVGLRDRISPRDAITLHHAKMRRNHELYPDVVPALEALAGRFKLAIVTNGDTTTQRAKIEATGLAPLVNAILVSGELGVGKPDPRIFDRALAMLDVPPRQAVHVGDSLEADVAGARASGIGAVWVNRSGVPAPTGHTKPDHQIRSLAELPTLVDQLLDQPDP
jgi:putative hydrolase of the HAD superfamily